MDGSLMEAKSRGWTSLLVSFLRLYTFFSEFQSYMSQRPWVISGAREMNGYQPGRRRTPKSDPLWCKLDALWSFCVSDRPVLQWLREDVAAMLKDHQTNSSGARDVHWKGFMHTYTYFGLHMLKTTSTVYYLIRSLCGLAVVTVYPTNNFVC